MKRILIAAMFVAAPAFAAAPDEEAIKTVFVRVDSCVAKSDSKCLGELFADDATFAGPMEGGKIVKGKAAIIKAFGGLMKEPAPKDVKQERKVENVRFVGEDRAFVDCSVKMTFMKESADTATDHKWFSTALMLRKDGKWLLEDVRFYVVDTGPPPMPPAAGESEKAPDAVPPPGADEAPAPKS